MYSTVLRQLLDFNKKAFEDSFKAMITMQEQGEKAVRTVSENILCFPEEGKKAIADWITACRKGLDEFKTNVDRRYQFAYDCLLAAAGQAEQSLARVIPRTESVMPAERTTMKKEDTGVRKTVARRKGAKSAVITREKPDKQKPKK